MGKKEYKQQLRILLSNAKADFVSKQSAAFSASRRWNKEGDIYQTIN